MSENINTLTALVTISINCEMTFSLSNLSIQFLKKVFQNERTKKMTVADFLQKEKENDKGSIIKMWSHYMD